MTTENKPKVIRLIGKLIILRIGFSTRNIKASAAPPTNSVSVPPLISTPGMRIGSKKRTKV